MIKNRYNELPDHPFKEPHIINYGVYRYKGNKKWYGLVMNIDKGHLVKEEKGTYVDVINVRIDESKRETIINNQSIYPSYHMNKQKWVSIILDDSLDDEVVMAYIDYSRNFMINKKK
ncbi:MAG: MmcQ/YjbR family DNA-binding protein [Bacilli bacterium]|nr:MmcQ/YjbR family DNA-binding protein [Bacilli bacterium]